MRPHAVLRRTRMHLADTDILKRLEEGSIVIDPLENPDLQIQPASVDVTLGTEFLKFNPRNVTSINPLDNNPEEYMERIEITDDEPFVVHPGDFVLATTKEWVEIPDDIISFVDGRSTLGRLGIVIHATAGLLDPGWNGNVTLEISNLGQIPVELTPGMRIGQLTFTELKNPSDRPYGAERGSKYQNQTGVQSAQSDHNTTDTPGRQSRLNTPADTETGTPGEETAETLGTDDDDNDKIGFN